MRAIDADELIKFPHSESAGTDEQIENWIEECGLSDEGVIDRAKKLCWAVIDGFINVVKTAPTLTQPNEWVSVEDAMPPEHEPVLCIVDGKPKPNITLEDAYQIGSWNKADGWIIDEYLDWEDADVSWWMSLPAPPDKDNNVLAKTPNEPLTLEQLGEMDGEPVWVTPLGFWALVIAKHDERVKLISNDGEIVYADKEIELVGPVYRRPPEGEA